MAKTCPECSQSHPDALEFCPLDGKRLVESAAGRRYPSTMLGMSPLPGAGRPAAPVAAPPAGISLAELLARGPLATDQATSKVSDICDALAADHAKPHGALTPAHIRYAGADGQGRPTILEPGAIATEPLLAAAYRAPESDAGPATTAIDVYALGCILFECLTGRSPFKGRTVEELAKRHAAAAAPAVRQVRVDCELPPALEVELQRALKKRPGDRHATLQHFSQGLRSAVRYDDRATMALGAGEAAFLHQLLQQGSGAASAATPGPVGAARAVRVAPPGMRPPQNAAPSTRPLPPPPPPVQPPPVEEIAVITPVKKGNLALVLGALVIVGAVAGLAVWLVTRAPPPPPAPEPVAAAVPVKVAIAEPPKVIVPPPAPDIVEEPLDAGVDAEEPDAGSVEEPVIAKDHKRPPPRGKTAPTSPEVKKPPPEKHDPRPETF